MSNFIFHDTYIGRRIKFRSKPTPFIGTVHKPESICSYFISQFSFLPQALYRRLNNNLSQKVSYVSMIIYPVIIGFSLNEQMSHFHICYYLIIILGKRGLYFGFSNTDRVGSLERFRKVVFEKVNDII